MDTSIDLPPPSAVDSPSKTPSKSRSFSDPPSAPNTLQPSPTFRERLHNSTSKDDNAVPLTPRAGRRPDIFGRGLSLQMPSPSQFPTPGGNASSFPRAVPLSPRLDSQSIYMQSQSQSQSPATSIPRHSRGLDFSRACTTLHHSTIAESSPGSSPVITHKAMNIPQRRGSISSMMLDSPNMNGSNSVPWGSLAPERSAVSSSVGSINMMGSESESSDSDEDASMCDETEDAIFTTPQVHKLQNPNAATPFAVPPATPGRGEGGGGANAWGTGANFSPAQASLMKNFRRAKLQKNGRRSRKSSSSASGSGYSSMNSPRATSPPPMRSIETASGVNGNGGFFNWNTAARSRRESLAMGTDGLHLSSGNDSGDEASGNTAPSTPGVVRRAVTRRGNLLPKTKGFARIRAALMEEAAPIDSEVKREAETMRQVHERDGSAGDLDLERPQTATAQSSPSLLPAVPESDQENFGNELLSENSNIARGLGVNFAAHASRNSGGMDYWNRFDPSTTRTPPPPNFHRQSSSVLSDAMQTDADGTGKMDPNMPLWRRPRAQSSASDASEAFAPNSAAAQQQPAGMSDDMHLQQFKKRRREDDFDISTIKRRAVSPGMSAQNSPVLTQSPSQKDGSGWGQPPEKKKEGSIGAIPEMTALSAQSSQQSQSQGQSRHGSGSAGGSISGGGGVGPGGKKLGLQGMVDTNDGLMKMSIE